MKFATATPAPKLSKKQTVVSTVLAAIFTIAATAQLFAFEDYPQLIATTKILADNTWAPVLAALIVTGEIFAIPYLLRMSLSPLMRVVSKFTGWLVLFYWFVASLWQITAPFHIENIGFFGTKLTFLQGWALLLVVIVMACGLLYVNTKPRK